MCELVCLHSRRMGSHKQLCLGHASIVQLLWHSEVVVVAANGRLTLCKMCGGYSSAAWAYPSGSQAKRFPD